MRAEETKVRRSERRSSVNATRGSENLPPDARLFAHPRLEIAASIARTPSISFRALCDELELSDGNLSAHLRALETDEAIQVQRTFDGRRRLSQYTLTTSGRERLRAYLGWVSAFARELEPFLDVSSGAEASGGTVASGDGASGDGASKG
jgi:DNA-binding MarR family transcriptional regulator